MKARNCRLKLDFKLLTEILHKFVVQHHVPADTIDEKRLPVFVDTQSLVQS